MLSKEKSLSRGAGREKGLTWAWERRRASQPMCVRLPRPPQSLPWAPGTPPATVGHGSHLEGCRSLPGHRSCPPWLSSACSLPAQGCGTHQHPTTSLASPHIPQCHPLYPYHTHDTPWHPTPVTLSTTLHTPPAPPTHTPISPLSPPPTIPSPFGGCNWGLPPHWARRQPAGSQLCPGGSRRGTTKGWGRSQGGKYGDQGEDAANSMVGQAPGPGGHHRGDARTVAASPRQEEEALCSCQHFWGEPIILLRSILGVQGLNVRGFR